MSAHPATLSEAELLANCEIRTTRRSGPGGQHRNKVETAVVVTHVPSGLTAEANERRSQEANRITAVHRLRTKLAIELRTIPTNDKPSELWQGRVRSNRIAVNNQHADFPALLAEAFNRLHHHQFDIAQTAAFFQVSGTQLVRLIKQVPAAFVWLNNQRESQGLHSLK